MPESEHLTLYPLPYCRAKDHFRNKCLLTAHLLIAFVIFGYISHESVLEGYPISNGSIGAWLAFLLLWSFGAFLCAGAILFIPALFLARAIGPEIILTREGLIYLGGSRCIKDSPAALLLKPLIYLGGMENSLAIRRSEVDGIQFTKAKSMIKQFKLNDAQYEMIEISHEKGKLLIGGAFINLKDPYGKMLNWYKRAEPPKQPNIRCSGRP